MGRSRGETVGRRRISAGAVVLDEQIHQVVDGQVGFRWTAGCGAEVECAAGASSDASAAEAVGPFEVGDDGVGGALGDVAGRGDVAEPGGGVACGASSTRAWLVRKLNCPAWLTMAPASSSRARPVGPMPVPCRRPSIRWYCPLSVHLVVGCQSTHGTRVRQRRRPRPCPAPHTGHSCEATPAWKTSRMTLIPPEPILTDTARTPAVPPRPAAEPKRDGFRAALSVNSCQRRCRWRHEAWQRGFGDVR